MNMKNLWKVTVVIFALLLVTVSCNKDEFTPVTTKGDETTNVDFRDNTPALLQLVHNSPDPDADKVDIYINNTLVADDISYLTATEFIEVPAPAKVRVIVAPANSASAADGIARFDVRVESNTTYIGVANGFLLEYPGFMIDVFEPAVEDAPSEMFNLAIHHGSPSTDATTLDVSFRENEDMGGRMFYSDFTDRQGIAYDDYTIEIKRPYRSRPIATYEADFSEVDSVGQSGVAIITGTLSSADAPFGMIVVLEDGNVIELPLAN